MRNEEQAKQLYIPEKLAVGFQKRDGTYNGMLAYVIYYDKTGTLRKEKSWQSWRDHKIKAQDIENKPTDGFVLNKKVGGYKSQARLKKIISPELQAELELADIEKELGD